MKYVATVDDQPYHIDVEDSGVTIDGAQIEVDLQSIDGGFHYSLLVGAASYEVFAERCQNVCTVTIDGQRYEVQVEDARARRAVERRTAIEDAGQTEVVSPMPGVVVAVLVEEGQSIRAGEGLLILEAMKMENEIRAPRTGRIEAVHVTAGQRVSKDDILIRFEP